MNGLEELEALTRQAEESAAAVKVSVSGGAGNPIEVRLAQAFEDTSKALSEIAQTQAYIVEDNNEIKRGLENLNTSLGYANQAIDTANENIIGTASSVANNYMHQYTQRVSQQISELEGQANGITKALDSLDLKNNIEERVNKVVDDATEKLSMGAFIALVIIILTTVVLCVVSVFFGSFTEGLRAAFSTWIEQQGEPFTFGVLGVLGAVLFGLGAFVGHKLS